MKFHGITMVGPFVNQKMAELPEWDATRDRGRLVWLVNGTLWYGSDTEWVSFASGAGDASEVEDMYSDLLRTTIFMNASYDGFAEEDLVASTNMSYNQKETNYTYTSGQTIESTNLYDGLAGLEFCDYFMVYVDYVEAGSGTQVVEATTDGGVNWTEVDMLKTIKIPNSQAAKDLRLRFTGGGNGTLSSWGILYNKDLSASCTKWGLTYANFEAIDGQTLFELTYTPGAIQVFLNGDLLDATDYDATSGEDVVFESPLEEGDIVYINSFSTSILDPNFDVFDLIHRNGSVTWSNDQSVGMNKFIDLADGVNQYDAVNKGQLDDAISGVDLSSLINSDGSVMFMNNQSMGGNRLTDLSDAVDPEDAITFNQLISLESDVDLRITDIDSQLLTLESGISQNVDDIMQNSSDIMDNAANINSNTENLPLRYIDDVSKTAVESVTLYATPGSSGWGTYLTSSSMDYFSARNKLLMVTARLVLGDGIVDTMFRLIGPSGQVLDTSAMNNHLTNTQSNTVVLHANIIVDDIGSGSFDISVQVSCPTVDPNGVEIEDYPYFNRGHDAVTNPDNNYQCTLKTVII